MNRYLVLILLIGIVCILPIGAYERLQQGGIAYLNETYDISGTIGWCKETGCELVYVTEWSDYLAPPNASVTYVLTLPDRKSLYYNYTIDPEIFGSRLGWWYQNSGINERAGNLRAFKVLYARPPVNETINETANETVKPVPTPPIVEERHVTDYLVAQGDPLTIIYNTTPATSAWIFGRVDGIYDRKFENETVTYNATEIQGLEVGAYTLMIYSAGNNSRFDIRYNGDNIQYFDTAAFKVVTIDTKTLTPNLILDKIKQIPNLEDDTFRTFKIEVRPPVIDITSIDTFEVNEFAGILQIRGYTTLENGTILTFIVDEERWRTLTPHDYPTNTTVMSVKSPGSMRFFDVAIPIAWGNIAAGEHQVTATGPFGIKTYVPFWIYDIPEGQQRPNKTIKYIGGNIFVPTPTPEIVTVVQTQIVTQIVTVPVTPSNEQVYAQQLIAQEDNTRASVYTGIKVFFGVIILYCLYRVGRYLVEVIKRSRLE